MSKYLIILGLCTIVLLFSHPIQGQDETIEISEVRTQILPLEGEITASENQISGMAWYGDTLVMLPQYPQGRLYTLPKEDVLAAIAGELDSLIPEKMPFRIRGRADVGTSEGFESIVFHGDTVYMTLEANRNGDMYSYIYMGTISEEGVLMDSSTATEIAQPANIPNRSHESLVMVGDEPLAIYEWNHYRGRVKSSFAVQFTSDLSSSKQVLFPALYYRVSDATELDENGHFWVINFLFPDDDGQRQRGDAFAEYNNQGTHARYPQLERLVEMQFVDDTHIEPIEQPPLYLRLRNHEQSWEGLVRLDNLGFLLITDYTPETRLVFLPLPDYYSKQ